MLHALCALAYRRGQAMMGSTSPRPLLHDLLPPLQPTCPQCPAAGGSENAAAGQCGRLTGPGGREVGGGCGFGGGGTQWKVNWSIDQTGEERGKGATGVGRPVSFCSYCCHLLTFRSLCTIPFMWQWFTLSSICCMQWLWRKERPGQKQKGEEEGNR